MIVVKPLQWQTYHKLRSLMERVFLPLIFSSGGSVYNVYAEEEEDGESSAAAQQSLENFITMTKMKLLKAKMEDMNLNKKVGGNRGHRVTGLQFNCLSECKCSLDTALIFRPFLKCRLTHSCMS